MLGHVKLRCPRCHGRPTYEQVGSGPLVAECGTNCTDDNTDRLREIEGLAADLSALAFEREDGVVSPEPLIPHKLSARI